MKGLHLHTQPDFQGAEVLWRQANASYFALMVP